MTWWLLTLCLNAHYNSITSNYDSAYAKARLSKPNGYYWMNIWMDTWGGLNCDRLSPCGATKCPNQIVIWMYDSIAQETRKAIKHIDKGALQNKT